METRPVAPITAVTQSSPVEAVVIAGLLFLFYQKAYVDAAI
jgi:hypothetical protein